MQTSSETIQYLMRENDQLKIEISKLKEATWEQSGLSYIQCVYIFMM